MIGRRVQQRIYLEGLWGRKPPVPVHPEGLEEAARRRMSPEAWAYVAGGAGLERTMAANRAAFDRYRLLPRMLRGAKPPALEVALWGKNWAAPLFLAPIGVLELAHPRAELAAVRAAAQRGLPFMVSNQSSYPLEQVVEAARSVNPEAAVFFQLYHSSDPRVVGSFLRRAEAAGCAGVVLTVDTVQLGWRPRDLDLGHLPFLKGQGLAQYLSDPAFLASLEEPVEGPALRPRPSLALLRALLDLRRAGERVGVRKLSRLLKGVRRFVATYSFPELSWEEVRRVREATPLPLLLKGLLHPEDAAQAGALGVDGVYVSNHGGRQVDGEVAALEALPGVVEAVGGRVPVLLDSGVRTGADAVKALALGAKAVGLGRPYVYGLALRGEEGVGAVLDHFLAELELTLALLGVKSLEEVGPHLLAS
ncbi:alpha-hydroxy-acid oxidizing protein [Thermus thermamylovorans]|uniref:Lactate 2-monooxygenase n=1 Tax=Thermus thermamylovorans TaxID=2509362 RepID=A0A4Q9AZY7_9DEIN|nr:alpha-hydroxy-acid oxidizing protein [Thermus thermamylovorans]TBH17260.1 lactate 2-monooxygenase [Thermus thermamylovorans]